MSFIWNLDIATRNCVFIGLFLFYIMNYSWIIVLLITIYYWSELDEDDIGDDLEEYLEFFLDEFGFHDKWSNDVLEALNKYGDLKEHYSSNYSFHHQEFVNIFARDEKDILHEPIDHDYYKVNKELFDASLKEMLDKYLVIGSQYEYKYRGLTEDQIKNRKIAQDFYDSLNNTSYIKFTSKIDELDTPQYDDIDPDFVDYAYLYKIAEKYYTWFHTSNYPPTNNRIKDWEDLWLEKLIDKYDLKKKGDIYDEEINSFSYFLTSSKINQNKINSSNLDKRQLLFTHPYPIFNKKTNKFNNKITAQSYYLIFDRSQRWRNSMDFYLMKNMYSYNNTVELKKILVQQHYIRQTIYDEFKLRILKD